MITPRRLEKIGQVWEATGSCKYSIPNWFPCDRAKLRSMLQEAEAKAASTGVKVEGGNAQTGPSRRFQYTDAYAKSNEQEIAKYLRDNQDDLETHKAFKGTLENRHATRLVHDFGEILSAMIPSVREALLTGLADGKLDRVTQELATVKDKKRREAINGLVEASMPER